MKKLFLLLALSISVFAQPQVAFGPKGNPGSVAMNNVTTNCEHYDHTSWQVPFDQTAVIVSPKEIKNTGTVPFSFGLIQGNKEVDQANSYLNLVPVADGLRHDFAQDITSEVSFDGNKWILIRSSNGLPQATSVLTSSIHTVDPANVPLNGIILQPGQSISFFIRHTFPLGRLIGRKNLTVNVYVGLYEAGLSKPLFPRYTNYSHARSWDGHEWAGTCPGNDIFESSADTIINKSVEVVKTENSIEVRQVERGGKLTDDPWNFPGRFENLKNVEVFVEPFDVLTCNIPVVVGKGVFTIPVMAPNQKVVCAYRKHY